MMEPPTYFEGIRLRASQRWDQLESDPELAAPWHQLFKQVQSPRHVLSELLQNADDAGASEATVTLDAANFTFSHDGEDFTEDHFASLCRFGYSNKRALHTIGFRGIGFKSIFSLGSTVQLSSPTLSIAFESHRFTEPRWVNRSGVHPALTEITVCVADAGRRHELERNLQEWRNSALSLLFFRNVRKLRIGRNDIHWEDLGPGPVPKSQWFALNGNLETAHLLIRSGLEEFPVAAQQEIRQERMLSPDQQTSLPPCAVDIVLGAVGRLYVVLPTGVATELPFACNAPFIQDPARLKIKDPETSPTNRWLLDRAGALAAHAMLDWLSLKSISLKDRSVAYGLLPDVDANDASLEGTCGALVEDAFRTTIENKPILLTDTGEITEANAAIVIPETLREIWPDADLSSLFDAAARPLFSRHVTQQDVQKLINWTLLSVVTKADALAVLHDRHLPRPDTWAKLLKLWAYVSPDVTNARYYRVEKDLRIIPVQGQTVLYALSEVVRLGEKRLLQSDADWEFLAEHLRVLNPNWPRYLAERRRELDDEHNPENADEIVSAYKVLDALGLQDASDVSKVVDQVAAKFFNQDKLTRAAAIQLARIAAKLNAAVGPGFRFVCRDNRLRSTADIILADAPGLDALLPEIWANEHLLHADYGRQHTSCSSEEWVRWIGSGRSGVLSFVPLGPVRQDVYGRQKIVAELRRRSVVTAPTYHYRYDNFLIEDWDFPESHWKHWAAMASDDPKTWALVVQRLLNQPEGQWSRAKTAKISQVATTGNTRQITSDPVLPRWILRLKDLPCLFDTRGNTHRPAELLCRTPSTEAVMDVEPFVDARIDREANRPLLTLLGVRETPTGPDRLIEYLRAFSSSGKAPAHEVEKWYRRLDQMIDSSTTATAAAIRDAFQSERIILAEDGTWTNAAGAFLISDENDAPGVALIRAAVRDLALWRKVGVADQPTADLAIAWLSTLPSGSELSPDDARRVKVLLPRHATRIWYECQHWLSLAGGWVPIDAIKYALTMQSLVGWSHLHEWVKKSTADLQRLPVDVIEAPPFKSLALLSDGIEERLERVPGYGQPSQKCDWLNQIGSLIARTQWADPDEGQRIALLGHRLAKTDWHVLPAISIVPYIDGTPAGTARRVDALWENTTFYATGRSSARLARTVATELTRAFRRQEIADAIKICFERPSKFISDYMEANFELGAEAIEIEDKTDDQPVSTGAASPAEVDQVDEAVALPSNEVGEPSSVPDIEHDSRLYEREPPARERTAVRASLPSFIDRFAHAQGFRLNGDGRYCHPDGSWIGKAQGDVFPWERGTKQGEIVMRYWLKEHCLDREPLQIEAEVWSLIDKFPNQYALVLTDTQGNPTVIDGSRLRAMRDEGALVLYPATYRLKVDHENRRQ